VRTPTPSCPAIFNWQRTHGRPDTRNFDVGHTAHKLALGTGPEIVVVDAADWRTNAAKAQRDEARAAGAVPVLAAEYAEVEAMVTALRAHPIASVLLAPGSGQPEVSLFWKDQRSGVMLRGRLDWLPNPRSDGRLIIPDYKTSASADPEQFARAAANYRYFQQAAWYPDGVRALEIADDIAFVFIVQEKEAPYPVSVIELDSTAMRIGRQQNREAIDLYGWCVEHDTWPEYSDDVVQVPLPAWFERRFEEAS